MNRQTSARWWRICGGGALFLACVFLTSQETQAQRYRGGYGIGYSSGYGGSGFFLSIGLGNGGYAGNRYYRPGFRPHHYHYPRSYRVYRPNYYRHYPHRHYHPYRVYRGCRW